MIADDRKKRLIEAMAEAGLDMLLVYGNAWQGDYLRYATDFGILEGQALAIVRSDGHITLYLDSPLEVDRAAARLPAVEVDPRAAARSARSTPHSTGCATSASARRRSGCLPRRIAARAKGPQCSRPDRLRRPLS